MHWEVASWRGCRFVPYERMTPAQQEQARRYFSPRGRRDGWERIERWAFAVRRDGRLARCPYIEPAWSHAGDEER